MDSADNSGAEKGGKGMLKRFSTLGVKRTLAQRVETIEEYMESGLMWKNKESQKNLKEVLMQKSNQDLNPQKQESKAQKDKRRKFKPGERDKGGLSDNSNNTPR